jgi:ABC-type dipeptide/oligopeptide/nickel transport system permease component
MQLDPLTLILVCVGIALAVLIAVVLGTLTARLFFHASAVDPADAATRGEKPVR